MSFHSASELQPSSTSSLSDAPAEFPLRAILLLLAFLAVTFLVGLGHPPLIDPDEPVYGETGRVMALSHNVAAWWTPHYNGGMWFDKPPVTYWLIGLSMTIFGANDFAARLPMALGVLALVWVVARLARQLYPHSSSTPFWAALVVATFAQTLNLSRACVTDALLALCLTAALLGVWRWLTTDNWHPALAAGLAVGIGTLVKGPVAIVLVGAQALLYLLISRQRLRLRSAKIWAALLLSMAVAAPWYVSMAHLHGQFFVQSFLEAQNVTRYVKAEHAATSGVFFFVPVVLVAMLPWTIVFVLAVVAAWQRIRLQLTVVENSSAASLHTAKPQSPDLYALLWVCIVFVFFSVSQSKLITYIYPLLPLAACVIGYWVGEVCSRSSGALHSLVMLGVVFIGYVAAGLFLHQPITSFMLVIGALLVAAAWVYASRLTVSAKLVGGLSSTLRFVVPALGLALLLPIAALSPFWRDPDPKNMSAERAGQAAARAALPGAPIYCLVFNKPSVVYYSGHDVVFTDKRKVIARLLVATPSAVCITKPDVIAEMAHRGILPPHAVLSNIRGKAVVITGQAARRSATDVY